ncbi:DNA uptake protein ComE [Flexibacter flexilis DSM 6793]|uniref:DNA uptake protein ComE n=1 Tax=Flexibacter flexilis DSM 6793 TaxID=927664 RepID=A0A1I1KMF0_9BACT|nr:helix-hairpin-helix domain-containing protein [Flexibacter flexilis]SFC61745.1 DNA uptake protein ComE [Flexibacter flexilis DSM 6793]
MRKWIRDYFGFSQKEANGTVVLLIIMLLMAFIPLLIRDLWKEQKPFYSQEPALDEVLAQLKTTEKERKQWPKHNDSDKNIATASQRFHFNPNTVSVDSLQMLGISKYMAKRIDNYRHKGGKFRVKKDLKKMYGFPEELYTQLYGYIALPDSFERKQYARFGRDSSRFKRNFDKNKFAVVAFDVNTADSTAFIRLKGIGERTAQRILRYREKLGGFVSKDQYREIYGLDSLALAQMLEYAHIQTPAHKIKLNTATEQELKHPYMPYKLPKLIVNYREQHGAFTKIEDLQQIKILKSTDLEKLKPYLSLD